MEEGNKLSREAQLLIREYVGSLILRWGTILGVANLVVLMSALGYVFFILPGRAATEVAPRIQAQLASGVNTLNTEVYKVLVDAGKAQQIIKSATDQTSIFDTRIGAISSKLAQMEVDIARVEKSNLSDISNIIKIIESSPNVGSLIVKLTEAEDSIKNFEKRMSGLLPASVINNEFFGHEQQRSEGMRAPDDKNVLCGRQQYVCGLHYDHHQNDLTIEPVCCSREQSKQ